MIKAFVLALSILFTLDVSAANNNAQNEIEMFSGQARVFPLAVTRVAIGSGKVISVSIIANNQLLILAEGVGISTLHLWLKDGSQKDLTVFVQEANMERTLADIKRLLSNVDNVTARIAGSKIVLEGEMVSDINQERAQSISKMYPEQVVNFIGKVGWEKMIYLDVKVVELSSKGSRDLGIRWDSSINGPHAGVLADIYSNPLYRYVPSVQSSGLDFTNVPLPGNVWPPKGFITMASLITSKINLLVQDGEAQVLAAPSLTTRSGSKARFVSGGEIPIPQVSSFGQTSVEYKEYGIILEVTPVTDKSGAIYAKVDVEVSSIDRSVTVLGVPGFLKRKSTAEFNSREGETVVLNGLYSYEKSSDTQKVPGAGDVPLIGGLFRNKGSTTSTREVAIIITPRLVQPTLNMDNQPKDLNSQKLYEFDKRVRDRELLPNAPSTLTITE
ncbi:type II and III secretion system protein family protein [Undibacterium sp. Rencai35W]|uniref:type II and III secretion system protein family protein n=1 Tax=Undibacterium sp. Rencai35W TaxID=3413046 RepID=UPI003BF126C2